MPCKVCLRIDSNSLSMTVKKLCLLINQFEWSTFYFFIFFFFWLPEFSLYVSTVVRNTTSKSEKRRGNIQAGRLILFMRSRFALRNNCAKCRFVGNSTGSVCLLISDQISHFIIWHFLWQNGFFLSIPAWVYCTLCTYNPHRNGISSWSETLLMKVYSATLQINNIRKQDTGIRGGRERIISCKWCICPLSLLPLKYTLHVYFWRPCRETWIRRFIVAWFLFNLELTIQSVHKCLLEYLHCLKTFKKKFTLVESALNRT